MAGSLEGEENPQKAFFYCLESLSFLFCNMGLTVLASVALGCVFQRHNEGIINFLETVRSIIRFKAKKLLGIGWEISKIVSE